MSFSPERLRTRDRCGRATSSRSRSPASAVSRTPSRSGTSTSRARASSCRSPRRRSTSRSRSRRTRPSGWSRKGARRRDPPRPDRPRRASSGGSRRVGGAVVHPARADRAGAGRATSLPRVRRRAVLPRARGRRPAGARPHGLRAACDLLASRHRGASRGAGRAPRGAGGLDLARRPGRSRDPVAPAPPARGGGRSLAAARSPLLDGAPRRPAAARARQLPDRRHPRERDLLPRRARDAPLRLARDDGRLVPRRLRTPRDRARRHRLCALPPPRVRRRRHREDARPARPPRAARPLGVVGADTPRDRREHRDVRPDHRGALPCRALLRHGAARRRPRAADVPGRPLLVEYLGPAPAAVVLPLRPAGARVGERELGDARPAAAAGGGGSMTLKGYTVPRTPEGRSSLVPYPPWHYVGAFLVVDYWADPEKAVEFLPDGIDPHPDPGRCAFVAADWQSCSESGDELVDPSRSQYKEVFVVCSGLLDGEEVTVCSYIWVDRDFALTRGWIQGFPKKLGSIWITRSFGLGGPADPGMEPGARFGVTCAAYERRVAQATVALEHLSEGGPFHNAPPIVNVRHFPRLAAGQHDAPAVHELVRAVSRDRSVSDVWEGGATLELFGAAHEEIDTLAPVRIGRGYRFT